MAIAPQMVKNESGEAIGLDKDGNVVTGDANPDMVTLLAAPGGVIGQDLVDKHGLGGRIGAKPVERPDAARLAADRDDPPPPAAEIEAGSKPEEIPGEAREAAESGTRPFGGKGGRK